MVFFNFFATFHKLHNYNIEIMPPVFAFKSMLMRDVFAALLRDGEFASQFHLRPLAIPSWELYGSDMDGQKSYSALEM